MAGSLCNIWIVVYFWLLDLVMRIQLLKKVAFPHAQVTFDYKLLSILIKDFLVHPSRFFIFSTYFVTQQYVLYCQYSRVAFPFNLIDNQRGLFSKIISFVFWLKWNKNFFFWNLLNFSLFWTKIVNLFFPIITNKMIHKNSHTYFVVHITM